MNTISPHNHRTPVLPVILCALFASSVKWGQQVGLVRVSCSGWLGWRFASALPVLAALPVVIIAPPSSPQSWAVRRWSTWNGGPDPALASPEHSTLT